MREKIDCGLCDTSSQTFFRLVNILLNYPTDVLGLSPAVTGALLVVIHFRVAANGTLMAVMMPSWEDRTWLASCRFIGEVHGTRLISRCLHPLVRELGSDGDTTSCRKAVTPHFNATLCNYFLWKRLRWLIKHATRPAEHSGFQTPLCGRIGVPSP